MQLMNGERLNIILKNTITNVIVFEYLAQLTLADTHHNKHLYTTAELLPINLNAISLIVD